MGAGPRQSSHELQFDAPRSCTSCAAPIAGLTDDRFLAAVEVGRSSTIEEAVSLALGELEPPQTVP